MWAIALEVERPRRGLPVLGLLAAAGLLRPDAWVLSGAYWLWCTWPPRTLRSVMLGNEPEARTEPDRGAGESAGFVPEREPATAEQDRH